MTCVDDKTIAVLITCFNRRETTLSSLRTLFDQELPPRHRLRVLLTDDGSSDGTADAVCEEFPKVEILQGDGNLYWVGGMQAAWRAAKPADFYLWFNDDVDLVPGAILKLFSVYHASGDPAAIVVGATCDPDVGKTCTGGIRRASWYDARVMEPTDQVQMCDAMNGNIVLVPREAEERLGMMDDRYTHIFADADYAMRARKQGIPVLLAPGHLGSGRLNSLRNSTFDPGLPVIERWRKYFGPKGYRPPDEWWVFVRAHAPRPKVFYWAAPYILFWVETILGGKVRLRRDLQRPMELKLS
jgi:GT2 family glycosyltransferase